MTGRSGHSTDIGHDFVAPLTPEVFLTPRFG